VGPRRPGDIASCYAESRLAMAELGWRASIPLAQGLAQTASDYIARRQSGTEVRL
jgi:UDP-glucose 4-epimerase